MSAIAILVSLFLFFSPFSSAVSKLQTFKIDLDLPAEARWKDVILAKKEYILQYSQLFTEKLESFDLSELKSEIEQGDYFAGTDFEGEIEGIAEYSGLDYSQLVLINFMYEIFAGCTSIAYEGNNGEIVLAHNLDYFFTVPMANAIVQLDFYRSGSFLYSGQVVAGQLGVFTALRPEAFAITFNQRAKFDSQSLSDRLREMMQNGVAPVAYSIRKGLESIGDFDSAVRFFSDVSMGSGCYLILIGAQHNQGIVLTRGSGSLDNVTQLNDGSPWYLVQTNSDRDLPNYEKIDIRRITAEKRVAALGSDGISPQTVIDDVLALSPNKNSLTISSCVISVQKGTFETTMWV